MTSSSADCTFAGARLISSVSTKLANTGPSSVSKVSMPGLVDAGADDVGGHQVGGELQAGELPADDRGQRLDGERLGDAGHPLEQDVPAGQQGDEHPLDQAVLADDDPLDLEEGALDPRGVGRRRDGLRAGGGGALGDLGGGAGGLTHCAPCSCRCPASQRPATGRRARTPAQCPTPGARTGQASRGGHDAPSPCPAPGGAANLAGASGSSPRGCPTPQRHRASRIARGPVPFRGWCLRRWVGRRRSSRCRTTWSTP